MPEGALLTAHRSMAHIHGHLESVLVSALGQADCRPGQTQGSGCDVGEPYSEE